MIWEVCNRSWCKRSRNEASSAPSSAEADRKRPRKAQALATTTSENPSRSYRECLTAIKMAVVPSDFPATKLQEDHGAEIESSLVRKLCRLPDGTFPIFEGTYMERGALIVTCSNQQTVGWLTQVISEISVSADFTLKVGDRKDILRANKVLLRAPAKLVGMTTQETRTLISEQNASLKMADWFQLSAKEDREKGTLFVFLVDDAAIEALRAVDFVVHVGLWKSTVLQVSGKKKDDKTDSSQSTSQQGGLGLSM